MKNTSMNNQITALHTYIVYKQDNLSHKTSCEENCLYGFRLRILVIQPCCGAAHQDIVVISRDYCLVYTETAETQRPHQR